jgi:hypothetical protein
LIAQLTSANAAQYSVVSFICHIQSPFITGFAASASAAPGTGSAAATDQVLTAASQLSTETNRLKRSVL